MSPVLFSTKTIKLFFFSLIDSEHLNKSGVTRTLEMLSKPTVMYPLVLRMAAMLPTLLLQSMGSVITMEYFKLGPKENGLFLATIGLASAVCYKFNTLFIKVEYGLPNFPNPRETNIGLQKLGHILRNGDKITAVFY